MKKQPKHKCEARLKTSQYYHSIGYPCIHNAIVERDGKRYCGIHDPVRMKESKEVRNKTLRKGWDEERRIRENAQRRRKAEEHYCKYLLTNYLESNIAKEDFTKGKRGFKDGNNR